MNGIKELGLLLVIVTILSLAQCKQADVFVAFDTSSQYQADSLEMVSYIGSHNLDPATIDTTSRLSVYAVLDSGNGETLEFNDIVSYNYIVKSSDDSVRLSNILSVAVQNELDSFTVVIDTVSLEPLVINKDSSTVFTYQSEKFTLAPSDWTLKGIFSTTDQFGSLNTPYKEALAAIMPHLNVGGHGIIIMPSASFYGRQDFYSKKIWIVEVFPVFVRKPNS